MTRSVAIAVLLGCSALYAQQCDTGVEFSGPIQISSGGVYSGNWQSTDPSIPAVNINTAERVTIINSRVRGPGDLIHYYLTPPAQGPQPTAASSLTVQQSCFVGTNPNFAGVRKGTAIWVQNSVSVLV